MTEGKERSALFKFLYTFLRIITFPIFVVLYVLKHPLWVMLLLVVAGCLVVYYPMSAGAKLEEVPAWYKNKYSEVKLNVVQTAVEKGHGDMFSEEMLKDLTDEVEEQQGLKSENYNAKISRDEALQEKTIGVKKRGGFKRKGGADVPETTEDSTKENTEEKAVGGLEAILKGKIAAKVEKVVTEAETAPAPVKVESSEEKETVGLPLPEQNVPEITKPEEENSQEKKTESELDEFELF